MSTNLGVPSDEADVAVAGACPTCDFLPDSITTADAVVALRSFPNRWRSALALHLDDADPEGALILRPTPSGWSALEHAGHVRDVLHALDIRLQRVLREDEPVLPETHVTPPSGANEQGMAVVLAALNVSADQFSTTIQLAPAKAFDRIGRRSGAAVTALDLVREGVHEGNHHLRLATQTLDAVRGGSTTVT
jgi:hypothetical protein